MAHTCPRPSCLIEVPDAVFACRTDWFELPLSIRARIVQAWARRQRGGDAGPHLEAIAEALEFWRPVTARP